MIIQKRRVNTKRHTTHWKIGGRWYNRKQAVELAQKGKVDGVRVGTKGSIKYITSLTGYPNLYDLPSVVGQYNYTTRKPHSAITVRFFDLKKIK